MDPSIMKFLEEDEDETMHSGADVDAFTAALNRDIEGDASTSQILNDGAALSQESSYSSNQFVPQWQTSSHDETGTENTRSQQDPMVVTRNEAQACEMDLKQHGSVLDNQKPPVDSFTSQVDQNMFNVSQAMTMRDSKDVLVHNQVPIRMQNLDHNHELTKLQNINNQQPSGAGNRSQLASVVGSNNQQAVPPGGSNQPAKSTVSSNPSRGKQVPFAMLLPVIQPQLDKDRAMQLNTLYQRLRQNEISKEGFVRLMRSIVGDQMLKLAVYKISQAANKSPQNVPNQLALKSQASSPQQLPASSSVQMGIDSSGKTTDGDASSSREVERQLDSHEMKASQKPSSSLMLKNQDRDQSSFPLQGINKQQQQHMHFSQPAYPAFGASGSNYHPHSTTNTSSAAMVAKQPHDLQMRQIPVHPSLGTAQPGAATQGINVMNIPKFDQKRLNAATHAHTANSLAVTQKGGAPLPLNYIKQEPTDQSNEQNKQFSAPHGLSSLSSVHPEQGNAIPETLRDESFEMGFTVPASSVPSNLVASATQADSNNTLNSKMSAANSSVALGNNVKALPKKPSVGQKKPLETLGSPPLPPSKKQKVSGTFLDQSIEQLNDVTAVSGVNLREEEEQLFSRPKEESRVSEASRRVVQEEEERLILEKVPLQQKLAKIMAKSGIKNMSNDVERCLSLAVEERLRGLVYSLIRLSKQREEIEKLRHNTVITSDVGAKIRSINQKARGEWEKKQAEAEKLQRQNEPESNHPATAVDGGEKDKDETRGGKAPKSNKEEDDKMRTTAANVAARAAVGGDDMLSKWQLMAEQAKQKRVGGADAASSSSRKVSSLPARRDDNSEAGDKRGQTGSSSANPGGAGRKVGRNQGNVSQQKATTTTSSTVTLKDLIFVFEREPQMAKSVLLYKLYDKISNDDYPPE